MTRHERPSSFGRSRFFRHSDFDIARSVTVYRSAVNIKTLTENDELSGEDVVPGFRCRVAEIFGS